MEVNGDSGTTPPFTEAHSIPPEASPGARPQPPMLDTAIAGNSNVVNKPPSLSAGGAQSQTPRRSSHSTAGMFRNGDSPSGQKTVRRSSSTMSLGGGLSPKLSRKSSRTSLSGQGEKQENQPTPKHSISNLITGLRETQSTMESIEEPLPLTASGIAVEHFQKELDSHAYPDTKSRTLVLLHDACYGHRWSRLKTTKAALSMIVERPERLQASVLGASAAYVRLGEHHAGAANAPHPDRVSPTAPPFKIRRTSRNIDITSPFVTNVHGLEWMSELRHLCDQAGQRLAAGAPELTRANQVGQPDKAPLHEGDLYLAAESLHAFQGALGGVADAVDAVFDPTSPTDRAFVAVRPPGHHCSADHPSGFCWLNNVHVGIEYAAQIYGLTHAAILDFDLHHGDGSQQITWERNSQNNVKRISAKPNSKLKLNPDIGYYSIHDINSYPCEMGDDEKVQAASLCIENAHGQNIWNVHLQPWKTEDEFWQLYETRYRALLDKARAFLHQQTARMRQEGKVRPKAAIFISAGFDASEWEGAGMQRHNVSVPTEFYARFTKDVVDMARESDSACDGRIVSVLEGGYSDRALCSGVLSHLSGLCAAPIERRETAANGGQELQLDQLMRGLQLSQAAEKDFFYDKTWWSPGNLTALENKINPPPPPQAKKGRTGPQPTYATPTESFAYKVVDTDKFARSISGTMREAPKVARPPTPPPPDVDWVVATQELSKLLIPTDRQTRSHTAEELGGVRLKKEKSPIAAAPPNGIDVSKGRQLRDRAKGKAPVAYPESVHSDEIESTRSVSRSSDRRQTMHELPSVTALSDTTHQRRVSRRLSAASTLSSATSYTDIDAPPVPPLPASSRVSEGAMRPPKTVPAAIDVKKTRAPAKPTRPGPVVASGTDSKAPRFSTGPRAVAAPSTASNATISSSSGDMDKLAIGLKRVTMKVGSREEHDRKQKEKEAAERRARALKGAETRRLNAAAKKAVKENVSSPSALPPVQQPQQPQVSIPQQSSALPAEAVKTVGLGRQPPGLASSETQSPAKPSLQPDAQGVARLEPQDEMVSVVSASQQERPSQALQPPQPVPLVTQQGPVLPANNGAAGSPPRFKSPHKSHLPVWSSTGVIPFAPVASSAPPSPAKHAPPESGSMGNTRRSLPSSGAGTQPGQSNNDDDGTTADNIRDLPVIPQH